MSQEQKFYDGNALSDIETLTGNAGGAIGADAAFNINLLGGANITSTGAGNTITFDLTGTTDHCIQIGNATGSLTSLGAATDGQIFIGSAGADPVIALPTNGNNITWTGGAGTLRGDVTGTTDHTVQIGNAAGSLTSLGAMGDGDLIIGSAGADPVIGALTSLGGTIIITPGAGTINLEGAAAGVLTLTGDIGGAINPDGAGNITVAGGVNITTTGAVNTITFDLDDAIILATSVTSPLYDSAANMAINSLGTLDIDAATALQINSVGGAISIGNDADAFNIDVGTGAAARVITIGNITNATQVVVNSGTGGVQVTSTGTGDITLDSDDTLLIDSDGILELNSSAGAISIGNDDIDQAVNIATDGERVVTIGNVTGITEVDINSGTGGINLVATSQDITVQMGDNAGVNVVSFADSDSVQVASIDSDGDITANSISFGDEALNTYDEGTFTPVLAFGGASVGITYGTQQGYYTRIGDIMYVIINIILTNKGTSNGNATISGLPATSIAIIHKAPVGSWNLINLSVNYTMVSASIGASSALVSLQEVGDNSALANITNAAFQNTSNIQLQMFYKV